MHHNLLPLPFFHLYAYLQTQPLFSLTALLCTWEVTSMIDRKCGNKAITNPVLVSIVFLSAALLITRTPYSAFFSGAQYVHFLLGPATVALAVPMYNNLPAIKRDFLPIIVSLSVGSLVASASGMVIAHEMGAPNSVVVSLGPKSVTTPIAMGLAQNLGGQPSLAGVFVLLTGMLGVVICSGLFRLCRIRDWRAQGLAAGTAAHGLATARMLGLNQTAGVFSGLAIGLNGVITSLFLPLLVRLFGY